MIIMTDEVVWLDRSVLETNHLKRGKESTVIPGELITSDPAFMRGHGTFVEDQYNLYAAMAGKVEKVNKLISVKPLKTRYIGEIGDVIIGRVIQVSQNRWEVDINAYQHATLQLSAIYLPGGIQRRKLESDELQIRRFFVEGDLLSAEIQTVHQDGSVSIHARSLKYGKLFNGIFVSVSPNNIKRSKSHFHKLPCGVDVILGLNGYIWIGKSSNRMDENEDQYIPKPITFTTSDKENVARVRNCIHTLDVYNISITDTCIIYAFESSLSYNIVDILNPSVGSYICKDVLVQLEQLRD